MIYKKDPNLEKLLVTKDASMRDKVLALNERVSVWKQEVLNRYCPECTEPCCSKPNEHEGIVLNLTLPELQAVTGFGRKRIKEMLTDVDRYKISLAKNKDGTFAYYGEYALFTKSCPLYDQAGGICKIHNLPEKPLICDKYPFELRAYGADFELSAYFGCEGMRKLRDHPEFLRIIDDCKQIGIKAYREVSDGRRLKRISF